MTRDYLLNRVWKYDFFGDERIIDTHIKNLRKKIGENLNEVTYFTVYYSPAVLKFKI